MAGVILLGLRLVGYRGSSFFGLVLLRVFKCELGLFCDFFVFTVDVYYNDKSWYLLSFSIM